MHQLYKVYLIGEKGKYQGRKGEKVESIACSMCGSQDESLIHFLCECVKLNEWRRDMYGKESKTVQNRDDTFLLTVNRYKII